MRVRLVITIWSSWLAATPIARAQETSPEEREAIEKAIAADADTRAKSTPPPRAPGASKTSLAPDFAVTADVAFAWFTDEEPMQTGAHDPSENGFTLQQVELSIGKAVDPYFRLDAYVVLGPEIELEEAYATTLALPWNLQARAGQFLTRFGRHNPTHPHAWDFVDQPIAIGRVLGPEGDRGIGLELSYLAPLPWYVELVGAATGETHGHHDEAGTDEEHHHLDSPLDLRFMLALEQFFEPSADWSLSWGLSAATHPNHTGPDNHTDVYGIDLYLKYRPVGEASHTIVSLQSEWLYRRRQIPNDVLQDFNGYAHVFWRFARRWGTALRYEYGGPTLDRHGERSLDDPTEPFWVDHRHRVSGNVTFWPTEFSRIRLQASIDRAGWRDEPIGAVFLAFEVTAGAHAAHRF